MKSIKDIIEIKYKGKLLDIQPYERNPKVHPDVQLKALAVIVKEVGWRINCLVNQEGVIIAGHGRWAMWKKYRKEYGLKDIWIMNDSGQTVFGAPETAPMTPEQADMYRLADNKLNESDWENQQLVALLSEMEERFVVMAGFEADIIKKIKEDEFKWSGKTARTQLGDLYELGPHRLLCGDSTNGEDYAKLLKGEKARLIFTDPPYSVDYVSAAGMTYDSQKFGDSGKIFNDDKTPEEALGWYVSILKNLHIYSTEDVTLYWWFASRLTDVNMDAFKEASWHFSQIALWLKNSLIYSPGQLYHRIYEPCMIGWKQGEIHYKDINFSSYTELWNLDKKTFADYLDVWYNKRDNTNSYIHPTQKPVALAERALKRSSEEHDIVLDAFGGSGSTMMACHQLDRKARLIELDPKYCDAIVQRYVDFTSDTDIVKNGQPDVWEISESAKKKHDQEAKEAINTAGE